MQKKVKKKLKLYDLVLFSQEADYIFASSTKPERKREK